MSNKYRNILIALIAVVLLSGCFSAGILVGWGVPISSSSGNPLTDIFSFHQPTSSSQAEIQATPVSKEELFVPFWEAWDIVHDQYVDQPIDDTALMQGAIRGMMDALNDPHTAYMNPDEYKQLNVHQQGEYEGIGAWVDISGDYLAIIGPMPGSPAEKAGLKPGDLVIGIDGEDMTGIDGELVLQRILGEAGTKVTLTIQREGESSPLNFEIERAKITVPSVSGEMLEDDIAYIQLSTFGDKTTAELRETLKELLAQNPKGLILDLRGNGGGYLHTSIQVASQFLDANQVVLYEEFGDGSQNPFTTQRGGLATSIPLVVLVDQGTASASEILAGAIQDYKRGTLVGAVTYGKGSVQNVVELSNAQGALRVTIARWLTPQQHLIHNIGLTPDIVVEFTEEDIENQEDVQLNKAIEVLLDQIK